MGDVGCHGGHHGRGGPGHGTGGVAATDKPAGQCSQHCRVQDGSSLTRFQALDY